MRENSSSCADIGDNTYYLVFEETLPPNGKSLVGALYCLQTTRQMTFYN